MAKVRSVIRVYVNHSCASDKTSLTFIRTGGNYCLSGVPIHKYTKSSWSSIMRLNQLVDDGVLRRGNFHFNQYYISAVLERNEDWWDLPCMVWHT